MKQEISLSTSRIEAFSDGVIAIIITVMVFDLKISAEIPVGNFWVPLMGILPKFLSYLLSFVMVAILWVNHHQLFHQIRHSDRALLWYNINLLFWMSLIPFATNLIGANPKFWEATMLYSLIFLLNSWAFSLLRAYVNRKDLLHETINNEAQERILRKNRLALGIYLTATLVSPLSVYLSFVLLLLVPGMYFIPEKIHTKIHISMKIAIIGTGNVGGTLASKWAHAGHEIYLGVKDSTNFKGNELLQNPNTKVHSITEAVAISEVILIAIPASASIEVAKSLGDTTGKIIIDSMNVVMGRGPVGYKTTTEAILANTQTKEVVKCFNTTGFNNMKNPIYGNTALDLFMAGDSEKGKAVAMELAKDAGFAACYSIGGNDKFELMEQFAWFWINLAMFQGQGREIGFKLLKR